MKTILNSLIFVMVIIPATILGQTTVTGTVTDQADASPLPGVNIIIQGTTTGAATDFDGNYSIKVNNGDVLVYSYVGYITQEIIFDGQSTIDVALVEDATQLDEIVLVGYGSTTVKDATGSVESVTSEDFTKGNIVTPENLISGRVAGVSVAADGGAPGATGVIRIRGGASINASNDPLIIIDGLPIENESVGGSRGVLSTLNPNDIESFSVLKDASATSIYGSRASNGVIIIVTKKGKNEFSLDIDTQYSFGSVDNTIDVLSADQFREAIIENQPSLVSQLGNADTDWQDAIFRETVSSIHNITARGSLFKRIPTRFSFGVTRQEGTLLTSLSERRNLSLALNPDFFDSHLKVNVNANLAFTDDRFASRGQIGSALRFDPTQPVRDGNSQYNGFFQYTDGAGNLLANVIRNPVYALNNRRDMGDVNRTFGNINLDYKFHFLPELKAVVNLGYDKTEGTTNVFERLATDDAVDKISTTFYEERINQSLDGYLSYNKSFNDFSLEATTGYSWQKFTREGFDVQNRYDPQAVGDEFTDDDVFLIGFFGRLNLGFKDKYLLTLNYRRDGTSRFGENNRWGDFGGAAFAWRISDENFLKDSKVISELKLRASYGFNGQQNIDAAGIFLNTVRIGRSNSIYQFGNSPVSTIVPQGSNPDIKWEETRTIELGLDYGLFDNRLTGSISAFQKDSEDLLFEANVSDGVLPTNRIIGNNGDLRIRGLEFGINADIIQSENLNWSANFNATFIDREITSLPNGQDIETGGIAGATGPQIQIQREGEAPNSFYVYQQLYDSNGNPIEGAYADLNGDNIINDEDRYVKENPFPNAILGFQSNFNYKNFDFAFNLRANLGQFVYNNVNSISAQASQLNNNGVPGNLTTSFLDSNFNNRDTVIQSDYYLENASFLRMDNITLGYTFTDTFNFIKSLRLWAGVQNVFVITDYSGLDPEAGEFGIDNEIYPRTRNILVGAQFKF